MILKENTFELVYFSNDAALKLPNITPTGEHVTASNTFTDLGESRDGNRRWSTLISLNVDMARSLILRTFQFTDVATIIINLSIIVHPKLGYCCQPWYSHTSQNLNKMLEVPQRSIKKIK